VKALGLAVGAVRRLRRAQFRLGSLGKTSWGSDFIIGPRARSARASTFSAGSRVNIGADFVNHARLIIGDDVMISSHVAVIGDDHPFDSSRKTIQDFDARPPADVTLEGDNLIGFGTVIVGPLTIGEGTIVGAGSLVTRDLPPNSVAYGRPAVVHRRRRDIS
jgi:chloramphenicol O-acetyltransferase type B